MSYDASPPVPPPPADRNRTPWLVALGAVVVTVLIAVAVVALGGSDDNGRITISAGDPAAGAPEDAGTSGTDVADIEVNGEPLPAMPDAGADPAIGMTIPTIMGSDYDGNPIAIGPRTPQLIVVMAHWCPHCQAEIPRIVEWNDDGEIPDGLNVTGVSTAVDEVRGNYPPPSWLEKEQWPFFVLADDEANTALEALGVNSFPTIIAVDENRRVALRVSGEADLDQFRELVDAALTGVPAAPPTTDVPAGTTPCPAADGSSAKQQAFDGPPPMCIDQSSTYTANVETTMGSFTITLDPTLAPATVNNFVFLARYHYYDGVTFHRVISDFMIQGGDPKGTGMGGPGYEFADELPGRGGYEMYSVAMANAGPDTNGSQFFIVSGPDGVALTPAYSLFGTVTSGTEVIDAIQSVPTGPSDDPITPVVINSVTIVEG